MISKKQRLILQSQNVHQKMNLVASPIKVKELAGANPSSRFTGANIRRRLASRLNRSEQLILDFEGVETISETFADECFSKLGKAVGYAVIEGRTELRNASPYVKSIIISAMDSHGVIGYNSARTSYSRLRIARNRYNLSRMRSSK
ncbi:STAS-like domain-containing protein [Mucilaginibacter sp. RCC_168]